MLTLRLVKGRNRTILYQGEPYFVAFPDLVFELGYGRFIEKGEIILSFRDLRVRLPVAASLWDYRVPLLPNIEANGTVCLQDIRGLGLLFPRPYSITVTEGDNKAKILFDKVLDRFWSSSFSEHLTMVAEQYRARYLKVFENCLKKGEIRTFSLYCPHAAK